MKLNYQKEAIKNLTRFAKSRRHSILISGVEGVGKTYLAKQYAKLLEISDFYVINPNVSDIRSSISEILSLGTELVICIENLDSGVLGASYTLLKFLEEPKPNVYIVITCRNIKSIPETILSRSVQLNIGVPIKQDIAEYAKSINEFRYNQLKGTLLWQCVDSLSTVDLLLDMTMDKLSYINNLPSLLKSKQPINDISWKLLHYEDNTETPIKLVLRYLMLVDKNLNTNKLALACIDDLNNSKISSNAIISKFLMEYKYSG